MQANLSEADTAAIAGGTAASFFGFEPAADTGDGGGGGGIVGWIKGLFGEQKAKL